MSISPRWDPNGSTSTSLINRFHTIHPGFAPRARGGLGEGRGFESRRGCLAKLTLDKPPHF